MSETVADSEADALDGGGDLSGGTGGELSGGLNLGSVSGSSKKGSSESFHGEFNSNYLRENVAL